MELYLKKVRNKGRGVFCTEDLNEGDIIEVCPVIVCPAKDCKHLDKTTLYHYYFQWGNDESYTFFKSYISHLDTCLHSFRNIDTNNAKTFFYS